MPQYFALKTFLGRFGQMHRGMTYTLPATYARDLQHNGLVKPAERSAPNNAAHDGAPNTAGEGTADRQGDGKAAPSSVSRQVRRSQRPTATTLNLGPGASTTRK